MIQVGIARKERKGAEIFATIVAQRAQGRRGDLPPGTPRHKN